MVLEDQRFIHEDLERLEQAIADRVAEDPRNVSCSWFFFLLHRPSLIDVADT